MKKPKEEQTQGQTDFDMNTVRQQRLCASLRQLNANTGIHTFNNKKKKGFL